MLLVSQMLRPRERIHVSGIQGQKAKVKVKAGLQEVTKLASSAGRVGGGKSCRHLFPIQGGSGRLSECGFVWMRTRGTPIQSRREMRGQV